MLNEDIKVRIRSSRLTAPERLTTKSPRAENKSMRQSRGSVCALVPSSREFEEKAPQSTDAGDFERFMSSELKGLVASQANAHAQLSESNESFESQRCEIVEVLQSISTRKSVEDIETCLELNSVIKDLQTSIHTVVMTMGDSLDEARRQDISCLQDMKRIISQEQRAKVLSSLYDQGLGHMDQMQKLQVKAEIPTDHKQFKQVNALKEKIQRHIVNVHLASNFVFECHKMAELRSRWEISLESGLVRRRVSAGTTFSSWQKYAQQKRSLQSKFYNICYLVSYRIFQHAWEKWKAMKRRKERSAQMCFLFSAVREWNLLANMNARLCDQNSQLSESSTRFIVRTLLMFSCGPRVRPSSKIEKCRELHLWMQAQRLKSTFFSRTKNLLQKSSMLEQHRTVRDGKALKCFLASWRRGVDASKSQESESLQNKMNLSKILRKWMVGVLCREIILSMHCRRHNQQIQRVALRSWGSTISTRCESRRKMEKLLRRKESKMLRSSMDTWNKRREEIKRSARKASQRQRTCMVRSIKTMIDAWARSATNRKVCRVHVLHIIKLRKRLLMTRVFFLWHKPLDEVRNVFGTQEAGQSLLVKSYIAFTRVRIRRMRRWFDGWITASLLRGSEFAMPFPPPVSPRAESYRDCYHVSLCMQNPGEGVRGRVGESAGGEESSKLEHRSSLLPRPCNDLFEGSRSDWPPSLLFAHRARDSLLLDHGRYAETGSGAL
uniref:Uncharacterized protein n=1 Tax=Hanusia phi TaxID=3032 RepID=A0A7S0I478_9CRYP|mmetsp:Transcript_9630/g.21896  ORF Transcript_9630/g.21896 Transcript_9630/m.21896 type:complete len:722 (+) Transcript_9630:14-2179(+)